MQNELLIALIASILLIFLGIWVYQRFIAVRGRRSDLEALAQKLSFTYYADRPELKDRLSSFRLMSIGYERKKMADHSTATRRSKHAYNAIEGSDGVVNVAAFDYRYTTSRKEVGGGKDLLDAALDYLFRQKRMSAVYVEIEGMNLPSFEIRPERLMHKIGSVLGYQDIDFKEHPQFSSQYLLRGPEEDGIRQVFNKSVIAFFEEHAGISAEVQGSGILIYELNVLQAVSSIEEEVKRAAALIGLLQAAQESKA